jgi:hypothetical protein
VSKASKLTPAERAAYLDRYDDLQEAVYSCEYGHHDCAMTRKGPCIDEVIALAADDDIAAARAEGDDVPPHLNTEN